MSDRVTEAYYGRRGGERDTALVRERVHWMCRRVEGPQVLDVGCSQGIAAILLARDGCLVTGVDTDLVALEFARDELAKEIEAVRSRVTLVHASINDVELEPQSFDSLLLGEVIEHVTMPDRFLENSIRFLKTDGRLVATTPFGLHLDPDHKQTFYAHRFLELFGRFCRPEELHLNEAYMYFSGRKRPQPLEDDELPEIFDHFGRDRLELLEAEAFEVKERNYNDQIEKLRARRDKLVGQLRDATKKLEKAHSDRTDLLERVRTAEAGLRRTATALKKAESARDKAIRSRDRTIVQRLRKLPRGLRVSAARLSQNLPQSISALIGGSSNSPSPPGTVNLSNDEGTAPSPTAANRLYRIVFAPTNGAGLGHLTRSLAVASRLSNGVARASVLFHTTSLATREIERLGYPAYYVPPRSLRPDLTPAQWNELLARGLRDVIETHDVDLVVFDGVVPYTGLTKALKATSNTKAVWISRGSWKDPQSHVERLLKSHAHFSGIIVPGEVKATVPEELKNIPEELSSKLHHVAPLVFLGLDALLPREEALEYLRLDSARSHLLIQLGAGNINDTSGILATTISELRSRFPSAELTIAQSAIANTRPVVDHGVHVVQEFPLTRYLRAFDLVVTAAGYNSVHEVLMYGIPAVIVPNTDTVSDNQVRRAERAASASRVETAHPFSGPSFRAALARLFGNESPESLRERWHPHLTENGAERAAELLWQFLAESPRSPASIFHRSLGALRWR